MKTIKSILIAATLVCASAVSTLSAQQAAKPAPKHEFKVAIGDSVMIKRECQQYLTGERPSVWVWDKVHTVRQLGTKRFPEGVLLMNIYSWICEDCLIPVNHNAKEAAEKAAEEQAVEKEAYEKAVKEGTDPNEAAEKAKAEAKKEEAKPAEETKPVEEVAPAPAPAPVEEAKPAEEAKPVEEVKPAEEPTKHEAAKGDSIHSKQNFRHGYDRFTIGLRGGVASQLHKPVQNVDAKWGIGGDVLLDLQYAHYWTKDGRPVDLGLIVGLSVGYAQGSFKGSADSTFKKGDLDYTVIAQEIKETDHQIQLEIPLMFSLIHENGLFFNVGPRFMLPVYTPLKQSINNATATVSAYDPETRVTMQDNIVTGKYLGQQPKEGNDLQFKINIMLTAEIGYEWILKSGNSLGLGAYANYCVYNSRQKLAAAAHESLLNVENPPSASGIADLQVYSATSTYANSVGYFDVGVKLGYHFNFPKKKQTKDARLF